jgi:hypothetical protein
LNIKLALDFEKGLRGSRCFNVDRSNTGMKIGSVLTNDNASTAAHDVETKQSTHRDLTRAFDGIDKIHVFARNQLGLERSRLAS